MYKLLIALMLLLPVNAVQLRLDVPQRVIPGSDVKVKIFIRNPGGEEVFVEEIRAEIYSERVFCLPLKVPLGRYILPLQVRVPPGEERVIEKVLEVPYVPLAGDFEADVRAYGRGELGSCSVRFSLDYTPLSLVVALILTAALAGILLTVYRKLSEIREEIKERRRINLSVIVS